MAVKRAGQIVLFRFPQTDLVVGKTRPALLLAPLPSGYDDWLVCMISTQTQQTVLGIDEAISITDSDFSQSGLKTDSIVRLPRLAVVSDSIFLGTIGEISDERLENLKNKLAHWIKTS
ncbi:MAG: type II toxin-antitoxin system PemK/MazF family toxin [Pyrinomonadaceae bacterium]|nr:type II toxin-antitoxin system PemK/MazF family toxin [Pyrinomonadaceae bacterium]